MSVKQKKTSLSHSSPQFSSLKKQEVVHSLTARSFRRNLPFPSAETQLTVKNSHAYPRPFIGNSQGVRTPVETVARLVTGGVDRSRAEQSTASLIVAQG